MDFRKFSAGSFSYGSIERVTRQNLIKNQICKGELVSNVNFDITELKKDLHPTESVNNNYDNIKNMMINLALNHSVSIGTNDKFCASSPDELALVNIAKYCGFEFVSR